MSDLSYHEHLSKHLKHHLSKHLRHLAQHTLKRLDQFLTPSLAQTIPRLAPHISMILPLSRLHIMSHLPPIKPTYSKMLLSVAGYMGASLSVAALADRKNFAHLFKQLGQ